MKRLTILAASIAALIAHPAWAAGDDQTEALARQALHNYAACAVDQNPKGAEKLLAMDVDSEEYAHALRSYGRSFNRCTFGDLRSSGLPLAGDLAEALIARKFTPAQLVEAAAQPEPHPRSMVEAIGQCVARAKPVEVNAVLATEPGSKDEVKALNATGDVLPGCIQKGKKMTLNKTAVRAMYALGAYHLLTAPPADTPAVGG